MTCDRKWTWFWFGEGGTKRYTEPRVRSRDLVSTTRTFRLLCVAKAHSKRTGPAVQTGCFSEINTIMSSKGPTVVNKTSKFAVFDVKGGEQRTNSSAYLFWGDVRISSTATGNSG